jgi:hypothetical protein
MTPAEIDYWAHAYIKAQMDPNHLQPNYPLWWAIEQFMRLHSSTSAEDCWTCILHILELRPPDEVLAVLASGPLEDLVDDHGPKFIDRIEAESQRNSAFRHLLSGVWRSSTPDIWARVEKAQGPLW